MKGARCRGGGVERCGWCVPCVICQAGQVRGYRWLEWGGRWGNRRGWGASVLAAMFASL